MSSTHILKTAAITFTTLVVIVVGVIFLPPAIGVFLDRGAEKDAHRVCDSVILGETDDELINRMKAQSLKLEEWQNLDGGMRYVIWFNGFFLNAAVCNIVTKGGKVSAKYVEVEKW